MTNEEENFNLEEEYQQEPEAEESPLYDEHSEPADLPKAPSSSAAATGETASQKLRRVNEEDDNRAWFVIHCYSGYENKVRYNLEQRIETMGMKDKIFDVVIPTQEEIEVREGKRRSIERHVFPGYVLVNMILTEESWYVVRNTPGVTGFVGMGNDPTPLRPEEVSQILKRMEAGGLIERRNDPEDGRALRLHLTPEGRERFHRARPLAADLQARILGALPEARREEFLQDLETVADACKRALKLRG